MIYDSKMSFIYTGEQYAIMLPTDEKKVILGAMRMKAIITISQNTEESMRKINEFDILMCDLSKAIWENAQRCLQSQNAAELLDRSKLAKFDYMHRIRTILGSMRTAYNDLRESVPPIVDLHKLHLCDKIWEEQKAKSKHMKQLDTESLPKRVCMAQDIAAESSRALDVSGTWTILRTTYNALCMHVICIPHEVLIEGVRIGAGAFGEVREYKIKVVSFFPEHITYCKKLYKGDTSRKFDSFQIE